MNNINERKFYYFFLLIIGFPFLGQSQHKPKVFFKEGDSIRLEANNNRNQETSVTIVVPKDKDTINKKDTINQDAIKDGKISIEIDKQNSTVSLSKIKIPFATEFELDSLTEKHEFTYSIILPRDEKDDKVLVIVLHVTNKKGVEIKELSKKLIFYIKPYTADTLRSNRNYELWFLTGTNFDLFDGVKAQEFFFRANTLFKISDNLFGQFAFYKNRSFSIDTSSASLAFSGVKRPGLGDSSYTLSTGHYRRTTKQTVDPVALQFDMMKKITNDSESNFFVTTGFEFASTAVTINNTYDYIDTTLFLKTSRPDTVKGYNNSGTTIFPPSFSYRKPNWNLNVGFMWILDQEEVNIKAQLTAGFSRYLRLSSYSQVRGTGTEEYVFTNQRALYMQFRTFATYKQLGLSFGLEALMRVGEIPSFNFTLSKAFDIKGFIKNFTPVSGLKITKD